MIKIKSQKIVPTIPAESAKASFVLTSTDIGESKEAWDFYAVFEFEGSKSVTSQVAVNVVTDVFSHTLILDDAQAVLQVLEMAVKESREALHKMYDDLNFNAVVAVFKDDYVYISIYGNSQALYLDGTQIVHVNTEKEGNYAGATQKIEGGKVMVLCTNSFFTKFPPKSLVSLAKPILAQDLDELSSAVIIKVDKEETPAPPVQDEPPQEELKMSKNTSAKKVLAPSKPEAPVVKESVNYISIKNRKTDQKTRRVRKLISVVVLAVVLIMAGYFIVTNFVVKPGKTEPTEVQPSSIKEESPVENVKSDNEQAPEVQGELTKKLDEANKVQRVTAQVFYDISIADAKTSPTELAVGSNYLAVSDSAQGKIYVSSKSVTKFEELPQLFPGVRNLLFDGDTLIFTDNEGGKFYSITTKSVSKSYLSDTEYPVLGPASEYLGFTYALATDNLVKFTKSGTNLSGSLWLQKPEFSNGVSMDIDGSIYILFSNGDLEKYTAGQKDDFSIVGLDKPIQKPLKVVTDANYKEIYVADGAEGRLIAFDTDGVLDFQIKPQLGTEWKDLKSFDVSSDEKNFYVLSGTKVFEFSL